MVRRKSGIFIIALFVIILVCLTGCSEEPINIGFIADLTGRGSGLGISARNGAELAADEINKSGGINGRSIQLHIKDDKGDPLTAVMVDKELISEKVILAIGHMTSNAGIAGRDIFNKAGLLMISPLISTESLSRIDDNFIRVIDSNVKQGELLAEAAFSVNKNKEAAIIYEYNNRSYTQEVCNAFKDKFTKSGGKVVYENNFISASDTDFAELAQKIAASGAEGVLISSAGLDLGILTQKIKKLKPDIDIYSGLWGMTEDAVEKGGKAIEGAYFAGVYDKKDQSQDFVNFRYNYFEKYKLEPDSAALFSYETVRMISDALKQVNNMDTKSIKNQIIKIGTFRGLQGEFTVDKYGDTDRGYYLFKVENSSFIRIN